MATNLKDKDPVAFLGNYSVDDLKQAITEAVAELAKEYDLLRQATLHPHPLTEADKKLLNTVRDDLTTVDLSQWRINHWEGVQDRLWHWYRQKNGQAAESGHQGNVPVG